MASQEPRRVNLLVAKLAAPVYPKRLVPRTRLTARLQEGVQSKLTLVVAPAGFGKTTLLREWSATAEKLDRRVAWVRLDRDDDGLRVWSYLLEAIRRIDPSVTLDWREVVMARRGMVDHQHLDYLINQIEAIPHCFSVILDDYQEASDDRLHRSLAYLIDHLPENMRLIISSRTTPPIPLARLRSQHQLTEVLASDLCFTRDEAEAFLTDVMQLALAPEDVHVLLEKTEGWIAGLQMAVLSVRGGQTARSVLREFSGDHRQVFSYLTEEVVGQQPDVVQDFLIRTSLLSTMTAELCDHVLGSHDSRRQLRYLEQANLFVVPLDERCRWYRYHPLFAEYLRSRLADAKPDDLEQMHKAACAWLLENGYFHEAIPHAFACGDYERAAASIEAYIEKSVLSADVPVVLQWIERLPKEVVLDRPRLALSLTMARVTAATRSDLQKVVTESSDALSETSLRGPLPGDGERNVGIVRITKYCIQGDYERAIELYRQLPPKTEASTHLLEGMFSYQMCLAFFAEGSFDEAIEMESTARQIARDHGLHEEEVSTKCALGRLHKCRGRLREAAAVYEDALQQAVRQDLSKKIVSLVEAGLSDICLEWGDLDAADRHVQEAMRCFLNESMGYLEWNFAPDCVLALTRNRLAHHDVDTAQRLLDEVELALVDLSRVPFLIEQTRALRVRYWIDSDNLTQAARWLDEMDGRHIGAGEPRSTIDQLAMARAALALGRAERALDYLSSPDAAPFPLFDIRIQLRLVRALALDRLGRRAAAKASLLASLVLAEPEGYRQIFADEGVALASLLFDTRDDLARHTPQDVPVSLPGYVQSLWKHCSSIWEGESPARKPGETRSSPCESLSTREIEILRMMATGVGNQEISDTLFISLNTTRTHIKHIYRKLGEHTRGAAIQRAILDGIIWPSLGSSKKRPATDHFGR